MHTPVLLKQVIEELNIKPDGLYIDATFGEGGHSNEILKKGGKVLGFEWDEERFRGKKEELRNKNLVLVNQNFKNIEKVAKEKGFEKVDGILFDFGLSMEQINQSGKGFSYKRLDEPLDMRIGSDVTISAADILHNSDEEQLRQIFVKNAEEIRSEQIANEIIKVKRKKEVATVGDLVEIIQRVVPRNEHESSLRRIFQALRVEVNHEYENINLGLEGAVKLLNPGGRLLIITFHPSEDRVVKKFMNSIEDQFEMKKVIMSKTDWAFERSAKLRVAIKR